MVGLSVILESNQGAFCQKKPTQVLSKASVVNRTGHYSLQPQTPSFPNLHSCYLCNQILLPEKDIYMYRGDRGFCSVECRCRQIIMDEQESLMKENNSTIKTSSFSSPEPGSSSSSMAASRNCKSIRNNGRGEFVYW